ncbi:nucleotide disphospho-sugar-binding domain-containing protein [Streptomyces sp. NPDC059454]|uniref:nucleotide disphospho-sugar-binding domain-containing protein n=1 Tax=Streptomyces sp. NPDC059454 TaxID=3346836 RepID=UPI0036941257
MRVLIAATPGIGHVFPTVPLAWALRLAGHEVLVATGGDALAVKDAGLAVYDVCPGTDAVKLAMETFGAHPELAAEWGTTDRSDFEANQRFYGRLMSHQTDLVDRYVRVAEDWRPDLVVHSALSAPGLIAAARVGVPAVEHGYGVFRSRQYTERVRHWNAELFDRYGVDLPERREAIDVAPLSLVDGVASGWSMRYLPYNGGCVLPDWLGDDTGRPRIAVTLGTTAPAFDGLGQLDRVLELAPDVDAEFVLALGDVDTGKLGPLADNVRLVDWVPMNLLLRSSAGLIHHGGSGTTLAALDAGVPQILMPDEGDRHVNAAAVADRGAGLSVDSSRLAKESIDALLHDGALRAAAGEVQAEMRSMPAPSTLVPRLEELAGE